MTWAQLTPVAGAAFLGSLVECVEALTVVLAVGATRGWRPALTGAIAGFAVLATAIALFGPMLSMVPLAAMQLVVGALLLLFGMRWLRKAILRSAGIVALHDEAATYAEETARMRREPAPAPRFDPIGTATSFKAVLLEGIEVAFIVIATGTTKSLLIPASLAAAAAALLVILLGFVVHRPLAAVPENALKFAVGGLISAFGIFWIGEGSGFTWPGADLAIVAMAACLLLAGNAAARLMRTQVSR